jgi:hypothetical protein
VDVERSLAQVSPACLRRLVRSQARVGHETDERRVALRHLRTNALDRKWRERLGAPGRRLTWLANHAHRVRRNQTADDRSPHDPLEHHQRLALTWHADSLLIELRSQVLDEHRGDRPDLVVAEMG